MKLSITAIGRRGGQPRALGVGEHAAGDVDPQRSVVLEVEPQRRRRCARGVRGGQRHGQRALVADGAESARGQARGAALVGQQGGRRAGPRPQRLPQRHPAGGERRLSAGRQGDQVAPLLRVKRGASSPRAGRRPGRRAGWPPPRSRPCGSCRTRWPPVASGHAALRSGRSRLVAQVGRQPALDLGDGHALAAGVVLDLVAADAAEVEVARLRVGEVDAAHAGGGIMAKLSVSVMPAALGVEQVEQLALLGVVGAGGVAEGGADAAVLLVDELVVGERLAAP